MQVERLASGLRHEPAFVAAALDASSSEASTFVSNMLKVDSVPSVLLYPEAARGCLKFLGKRGKLGCLCMTRTRSSRCREQQVSGLQQKLVDGLQGQQQVP